MDKKSSGDKRTNKKQFHKSRKIVKCAADLEIAKMKCGYQPYNDKEQYERRADTEHANEIFPKSHGGERNGRCEANGSGNKPGHESKRRMVNLREKMILASGTRQRGTEFAIAKRTTKRGDSADHPKHQQREPCLNIGQLKAKTGENAGPYNVGNHDRTGCDKADCASRAWRFQCRARGDNGHR